MLVERDESAAVSNGGRGRVGGRGEGLGEDKVGDGRQDEEGELDRLVRGDR